MLNAIKRFLVLLAGVLVLGISGCTSVKAEYAYQNGEEAIQAKEYDKAITEFTMAINSDPDDSRALIYTDGRVVKGGAYNNRGVAFWYKGDIDRAIEDFNAALRINPDLADAKKNLEQIQKGGTPATAIVSHGKPNSGTAASKRTEYTYVNPLNLTIPRTSNESERYQEYYTPQEYDPNNPIIGRWEAIATNVQDKSIPYNGRNVIFYSFLEDGRYFLRTDHQYSTKGEWQYQTVRGSSLSNPTEKRDVPLITEGEGKYIVQGDTIYFSVGVQTSELKFSVSADGQTLSLPLTPNPFNTVKYTRK